MTMGNFHDESGDFRLTENSSPAASGGSPGRNRLPRRVSRCRHEPDLRWLSPGPGSQILCGRQFLWRCIGIRTGKAVELYRGPTVAAGHEAHQPLLPGFHVLPYPQDLEGHGSRQPGRTYDQPRPIPSWYKRRAHSHGSRRKPRESLLQPEQETGAVPRLCPRRSPGHKSQRLQEDGKEFYTGIVKGAVSSQPLKIFS